MVLDPPYPDSLAELSARSDYRFVERSIAESETGYKQLIPYIVVICDDKILAYQRSVSTGEQRLSSRISIGWGGHIEELDLVDNQKGILDLVIRCATREIYEELRLEIAAERVFLGMIDDNSEPVGEHHLAYVEAWIYRRDQLSMINGSIDAGTASRVQWITVGELAGMGDFENWSAHAERMLSHMFASSGVASESDLIGDPDVSLGE